MKSSELNNLLSLSSNGAKVKSTIQSALPEYRRGLSETGRSLPIDLQDVGQHYLISENELINLCNWYLEGIIDEVELEYLASAIELSEDFQYKTGIANELFLLATPEINYPIGKNLIQEMVVRLKSAA